MILSSQVLLLLGLLLLWVYIFWLRSDAIDRVLFIVAGIVGIIFILNPQITTRIANLIGIGRGTDLLLYFFILAGLFYVAAMNTRYRRLNRQMTLIVRALAIRTPNVHAARYGFRKGGRLKNHFKSGGPQPAMA